MSEDPFSLQASADAGVSSHQRALRQRKSFLEKETCIIKQLAKEKPFSLPMRPPCINLQQRVPHFYLSLKRR
jgi:hypothetical protein